MSRSVTFDASRKRYRIRLTDRGDTKRNVPSRLFVVAGVPFDRDTPKGMQIAVAYALQLAEDIAATEVAKGKLSLAEIYQKYKKSRGSNIKPATHDRNDELAAHIIRFFGMADPSTITDEDAEDFRDDLLSLGLRRRTVRNELQFLRTLLDFGWRRRTITGMDDLLLLTAPDVSDPEHEEEEYGIALTPAEFGRVLAVPLDHYQTDIRNLFIRALTSGLRLTALLNLRWEWIDTSARWVHIPARTPFTKKGKAHDIPVPQWFIDSLPERGRRTGLVDPPPIKGNTRQWPIGSVKSIVRVSGIRYFSAHDLRRTFSTWLADAGVDKFTVSRLLTHGAESDVTERYIKEIRRAMEEAVSLFDTEYRPQVEGISRDVAHFFERERRPSGAKTERPETGSGTFLAHPNNSDPR